jgi:hypothetical protein
MSRQMAANCRYPGLENLSEARALKVKDVAFNKMCGLTVEVMAMNPYFIPYVTQFQSWYKVWYFLPETGLGIGHFTWKCLKHFRAYVWS